MAVAVETKIMEGLIAHLTSMPGVLPIAQPGRDFDPGGAAYVKPWPLPAAPNAPALAADSTNEHGGIFQVSVFHPTGTNITVAMEKAGEVALRFKRGTIITREGVRIKIQRPPAIAAPVQEPGWLQVPVSIDYQVFAPNP